jgi:tRNA nucleotidyltransferase (CCA-adding enzyme)
MKPVLTQAKKIAIPSKKLQKEKTEIAKLAYSLVGKQVSKHSEVTSIEFGGSYAKGTWLPSKADIDIFIKFKKSTAEKKFVEVSKKIGFESLKKFHPYVRYSEHPYVEAKIKGTKVNVVPCYDVIRGNWQSAADRSPFHTKFMLESLTGIMKDEVRLLKNFLVSNEIYGAEIAKQGISGYVTEVLVLHFGSFQDVISAVAKLKQNQVIGKPTKKFDTPIIIIDPIDSNRNLGAAISVENVGKFVLACRAFMKKPSISFFKPKAKQKVPNKNLENTIVVKFNFKPRSPDIIWGQIKRAATSLATQMEVEGFKVLRKAATTDEKKEAWLLFLMQSLKINDDQVREGPDFFFEGDSEVFIRKNSKKSKIMWIDSSKKIHSLQKRQHDDAKQFLQDLLKNHLNKSGVPKGLKTDIKKGFKIVIADKSNGKSIKEALIELGSTDATIFSSN